MLPEITIAMKPSLTFTVVLLALLPLSAQPKSIGESATRPKFADYPVTKIYRGAPAKPILSKEQRGFRTRIREGAKAEVQFAGHYTVVGIGCGTSCSFFYVVDSISGKVFNGFQVTDPLRWLDEHESADIKRIEFHPNSRLLKVNGCFGEDGDCGFYDFVMLEGKGLKRVHQEQLP